jgi:3-(3-hydroxy-phenyl)propionate hydroxylase
LLAPWGAEDALEIVRVAVYRFHADRDQWRRGRNDRRRCGASDAAVHGSRHVLSIRDAANQAWKLDLVLSRDAPDALLTRISMSAPHVRRIVERRRDGPHRL